MRRRIAEAYRSGPRDRCRGVSPRATQQLRIASTRSPQCRRAHAFTCRGPAPGRNRMKRFLALSVLGAVAAAGAQGFVPTGWWLNSGQGAALTSLVLTLLAMAIPVPAAGPLAEGSSQRAVRA